MLEWWGLHYNNGHVRVIKMMYRSMHHFSENTLKKECRLGLQQHGKKFCIALGTIATGVNGHEPLLSGLQLRNDLKTAKKLGVSEGIIFRLGGLNEVHQKNISEALEMENNFRDIKQFVRKAQPPQLEIIRELTANKEKKTKKNFVNLGPDLNPLEHPLWNEWRQRSPLSMEQCRDCIALSLCGGGCPYSADIRHGTIWSLDDIFCVHAQKTVTFLLEELIQECAKD